jgi:DNA-binding MarR family transcriptional regulator
MAKRADGSRPTVEEAYQVWKAVLRVQARMLAELDRRTAEADVLPPQWLDVLLKLSQAPDERLRMSDLAEMTLLSRGGITRLVTRIEADGLLRREACADDGRGAFAVLTPAGSDALRRAGPVYRQVLIDRFASHLTAAQARAAAAALEAVLVGSNWTTPSPDPAIWHATE